MTTPRKLRKGDRVRLKTRVNNQPPTRLAGPFRIARVFTSKEGAPLFALFVRGEGIGKYLFHRHHLVASALPHRKPTKRGTK
jgi:hypothetical protein